MRVLAVNVGDDPVWADIDNMDAMKDMVGGELKVEPVLIRDVVLITDESAILQHKSRNFIT